MRLRYDGRFTGRGAKGEGVVRVRFYIEPDGKITIGEVIKSPDEKLSREMIRVIRSSKGKWTPRKVRGVPQRPPMNTGQFSGDGRMTLPKRRAETNPAGGRRETVPVGGPDRPRR